MAYGWIITKDLISNGEEVGVAGPRSVPLPIWARLKKGEGECFRMLDDDRNVYYHGVFIYEDDTCWNEDLPVQGFEPLDDFGMPNAGCTIIQFKTNGVWEDL